MNTRLALYLSGAPFHARTIYRNGRRVAVIDRTKRWKCAARAMRAAGMPDHQISMGLRCSRAAIERVLSFAWRF